MIIWAIVVVSNSDAPVVITLPQELTRIAAQAGSATPGEDELPTSTLAPTVEPTLFDSPTETLAALADTAAPLLPTDTFVPTIAASATNPATYVVQSGDTLFQISLHFGITVDALKAANGLTTDAIFPGQLLKIPGLGTAVVLPTVTPTFRLASTATPAATSAPGLPTSTVAPTVTVAPATATTAVISVGGLGPVIGPSPTWSVFAFPTRAPASGPTKLGFHVTLNSGGILDYVAAVRPPVMKGVDDIGFLKDVKQLSPNTITIGRFVVPQENIGGGDAAQRAIDFVNEQLPRYLQHKDYVNYWEGWNEVTYPNYEWYAQFEAARACEMQKHGLKAAIGAFSTGTPEPWQFEAFVPAIEAGIRCGAILTTHEYGAPTMYLWWGQGLPESYGHPPVPAYLDRGPLAGRYRFLYRDILLPRGLNIPLVISEAGIDGGAGAGQRPGYSNAQGWMGFWDYWGSDLGVTDPTSFYVDQLAWYDSLLRQDSYVIGATIFNISGGSSWQSFDAAGIIPKLTEYALMLR
ncbi:MAG: LysM peptidoglycan-binding domain-containing protein [Chloroflexi bacterium]|nr:LysM peptidoglycan-binding domain-containing protein [Chloroflexota bacterium]